MEKSTKLNLDIEKLEPRIAPGGVDLKGNNGYGNGGGDPAPGGSGKTDHGKPEDVIR